MNEVGDENTRVWWAHYKHVRITIRCPKRRSWLSAHTITERAPFLRFPFFPSLQLLSVGSQHSLAGYTYTLHDLHCLLSHPCLSDFHALPSTPNEPNPWTWHHDSRGIAYCNISHCFCSYSLIDAQHLANSSGRFECRNHITIVAMEVTWLNCFTTIPAAPRKRHLSMRHISALPAPPR